MARCTNPDLIPRAAFLGILACLGSRAGVSRRFSRIAGRPGALAPGGASAANADGYLLVENKGDRPDRLAAITSPLAQRVSIHESRSIGGWSQ
jgi:hypothetical protein